MFNSTGCWVIYEESDIGLLTNLSIWLETLEQDVIMTHYVIDYFYNSFIASITLEWLILIIRITSSTTAPLPEDNCWEKHRHTHTPTYLPTHTNTHTHTTHTVHELISE